LILAQSIQPLDPRAPGLARVRGPRSAVVEPTAGPLGRQFVERFGAMSREIYIRNFYKYQNTCEDVMGAKRFKDQILAQILKTCDGEGKSKTKIVYASGLNFKTIMPYLITLKKNGLIEIIPGEYPLYKITQKGELALIHLRAIEELIPVYASENCGEACEEGM